MLKARAGELVLIGLSEENVVRLKKGMPIKFDGADLLLPGTTFLILYGETERAIEQQLKDAGMVIPE